MQRGPHARDPDRRASLPASPRRCHPGDSASTNVAGQLPHPSTVASQPRSEWPSSSLPEWGAPARSPGLPGRPRRKPHQQPTSTNSTEVASWTTWSGIGQMKMGSRSGARWQSSLEKSDYATASLDSNRALPAKRYDCLLVPLGGRTTNMGEKSQCSLSQGGGKNEGRPRPSAEQKTIKPMISAVLAEFDGVCQSARRPSRRRRSGSGPRITHHGLAGAAPE